MTTKRHPAAPAAGPFDPRCYGYVRVSSEAQAGDGESESLAVQRRQLEGWAMQRGTALHEVVVEPGVSGAVPFSERPEGAKLWEALHQGDTLVAAKLDRMFRSASDCLAVVEAFKARGVSLYLLDLNGGADDVSGNGIARLFLTIVSAFAEFERSRIAERIRQAKRAQRERGEYLGGSPPFGWVYDADRKLVPVEAQQRAMQRMKRLRDQGMGYRTIEQAMKRAGVQISHMGVKKALRRLAATP